MGDTVYKTVQDKSQKCTCGNDGHWSCENATQEEVTQYDVEQAVKKHLESPEEEIPDPETDALVKEYKKQHPLQKIESNLLTPEPPTHIEKPKELEQSKQDALKKMDEISAAEAERLKQEKKEARQEKREARREKIKEAITKPFKKSDNNTSNTGQDPAKTLQEIRIQNPGQDFFL